MSKVLRNRIIAMTTPGVTGADPFHGKQAAFCGAVFGYGIQAILGAVGGIATGWHEIR